jgi:hypothetical protein
MRYKNKNAALHSQRGVMYFDAIPVRTLRLSFSPPNATSSSRKSASWQQRSNDDGRASRAFHPLPAPDPASDRAFCHSLLLEQQWPDLDGHAPIVILKVLIVYP